MFKKLILLVSIIAIVTTACNKEITPMPDYTITIESQGSSIELRGGGFGPEAEIGPEENIFVSYEDESGISSLFFVYPTNPCESSFQTFVLRGNSAYFNGAIPIVPIIDITWEFNGLLEQGASASSGISTNSNQPTDVKCTVTYKFINDVKARTFELKFDAWFNEKLRISKADKKKGLYCYSSIIGGGDPTVSAIFP